METEDSQKQKAEQGRETALGLEIAKATDSAIPTASSTHVLVSTSRAHRSVAADKEPSASSTKRTFAPTSPTADKTWLSDLKEAPAATYIPARLSSWDAPTDDDHERPFREQPVNRDVSQKMIPFHRLGHLRLIGGIFFTILFTVMLLIFTMNVAFRLGKERGYKEAVRTAQIARGSKTDIHEFTAQIDQELTTILKHIYLDRISRMPNLDKTRKAATRITALAEKHSDISSLKYLAAITNLQASNLDEAKNWAQKAIDAGSHVSDAYAMLAIIDSATPKRFATSSLQARVLLEQAIAIDIANPSPRIELASHLRNDGKLDESEQMYLSALVRLHPVDSLTITRVVLRFIAIDRKEDFELRKTEPSSDNPETLIVAAYTALRFEDFELAERLLERVQKLMQHNTFLYLMQDRGFMKYSYRPEIKKFSNRTSSR